MPFFRISDPRLRLDPQYTAVPTYSCCSFPTSNARHVASKCAHVNDVYTVLSAHEVYLLIHSRSSRTGSTILLVGSSDGGKTAILSSVGGDSAAVETRVIRSIFAPWQVAASLAMDRFVGGTHDSLAMRPQICPEINHERFTGVCRNCDQHKLVGG